jgi:hypothetical protein
MATPLHLFTSTIIHTTSSGKISELLPFNDSARVLWADYSWQSSSGSEEVILSPMVAIMICLGFGLLWSTLSTCFIFLSIQEDLLIRRYCTKGVEVKGDVVSCIFARGSLAQEGQQEYICIVEYDFSQPVNDSSIPYPSKVRVRKQVKTRASDIYVGHATIPRIPTSLAFFRQMNSTSSFAQLSPSLSTPFLHQESTEDIFLACPTKSLERDDAKYVDMLILPEKPCSGYPKQQILRKAELSFRLSSLGLAVFLLSVTLLSIAGAVKQIVNNATLSDSERLMGKAIIAIFLLFYALEIPLMYFSSCNTFISRQLEQEYFLASDHIVLERCEDSTIPSVGTGLSKQKITLKNILPYLNISSLSLEDQDNNR